MITPNRRYWNIVKGIGIICVVLGHSCDWAHDFVYQFHLPLFFFVSGFMYSEKKYGYNPWLNLTNKLRTSWFNYVWIYFIILGCHNKLIDWGMMPEGAEYLSKRELVDSLVLALFGTANELMGGTLWFVPVLVLSSAILGFIVYYSLLLFENSKITAKLLFQAVWVFALIPVGWELAGTLLPCNMQVVLLVVVFQWIGYLIRNYGETLEEYLNIPVAFVCFLFVYVVSRHHSLDLIFGNVYMGMYTVAFCGIYVCLVFARVLNKTSVIANAISYIGKKSFWIMVLHFPLIKIIDKIWSIHIGDSNRELYLRLPHSFPEFGPIYVTVGIIIPLLLAWSVEKTRQIKLGCNS